MDSCKLLLEMMLLCCGAEYDEEGNPKHEFDLGEGLDACMEPEPVAATIEANLDACTMLASYVHDYAFSLFITEDSNLRIGARTAKTEDLVCVLLGGKIPFLIRPFGAQHILMEACYMNGFMHGEAIDGLETGELVAERFEIR